MFSKWQRALAEVLRTAALVLVGPQPVVATLTLVPITTPDDDADLLASARAAAARGDATH